MIRISCRAHDYGKHTPVQLAHILHTAGYTGAQLAMPRAIEGIEDFASVTDAQLSAIFQAFDAEDIEITVLSCYMDLSAPDEPARLAGGRKCEALPEVRKAGGCQNGWQRDFLDRLVR